MSTNFRELLKVPSDQLSRPKPLPTGHYVGKIKGHTFGKSKRKQTPYLRFAIVLIAPTSDVMGSLEGIDLSRKELMKDFFITPEAVYRLGDALDAILGQSSKPIEERISETRDVYVLCDVKDRLNEDGSVSEYNDVGDVIAAPQELLEALREAA